MNTFHHLIFFVVVACSFLFVCLHINGASKVFAFDCWRVLDFLPSWLSLNLNNIHILSEFKAHVLGLCLNPFPQYIKNTGDWIE